MSDVVLNGVSSTSAPGVYVQLDFSQGQAGAPNQVYSALILANCTSAGSQASCTAGTVFGPTGLNPVQTVQDAVNAFGAGSGCHLMFAAFKAVNPNTPLYVAPVAAATGTAATQVITITTSGTQSTGVLQYQVDGKNPVQCVFQATDSVTTMATNLAAAINGNINLPVVASSSAGVVTVTAKVVGARGNNLRGFANVVSGSGPSVSVNSPAFFTGGAGSDATGYTNTLNGIAANGQRYYYYIPEAGCDNIDGYVNGIAAEIQSQIDTLSTAPYGLRQRAVFGSNDTVAHTAAVTTIINDPRLEVVQCSQLDLTAGELAARWAAAIMVTETTPLSAKSVNFDGFGSDTASQPFWNVAAPLNGSAPSATDIQTCIVSGITPLRVAPGGRTTVVKRVTSRFFTLGGVGGSQAVLDLRITDAGKVTICDRFFDDLSAMVSQRNPRMLIGNDPVAGSPPTAPGVVSPSKMTNTCLEVIQTYASAGLINGQATAGGLLVQRNVNPSSTMGIIVPLFVADPLHQTLIHGLQLPALLV
jgi:phage tail sheath gpL-like